MLALVFGFPVAYSFLASVSLVLVWCIRDSKMTSSEPIPGELSTSTASP